MDTIAVLDFGGQYCHLIARRIRDFGVYAEVFPSTTDFSKHAQLKGIILSGGAASVYDEASPTCNKELFHLGIPIFGICYGHQLIAQFQNGEVISADSGEYGITEMHTVHESVLFEGLKKTEEVWMNHKDIVKDLPKSFLTLASTIHSPIAAFENKEMKLYGVQFHPEVSHTKNGTRILENFVLNICHANKEWDATAIVGSITNEIKSKLRDKKAIIGLSGGIDSSTAALLVQRVIGKNLIAVYVDTGLMRHKETEFIEQMFSGQDITLNIVRAKDRFMKALQGIADPEQKRKIIGKLFIDIFDEVAQTVHADVLIQGTIYSDRIESGVTQHASKIKSHHNVGGLPEGMTLQVYEPLRELYKDEVRNLARALKLPDALLHRQVFPGPGLAVRIIGEVTPEKVEIVRKASFIIEEELKKADLYDEVWMAFAVLLSIKSVGIQGDERTYKYPVVVRIIESKDAMTANFSKIPYGILEKISTRITNEIKEVNRVVYDISNKPPATMEWE
ncbi:glutamine-hydrolyzing GMP synthase [Candidatus Woesearchaeota archaeon]|nr:MAG: glutamine-hydrolyzing GMP synthase [Candidatus Woesearchaeota archaeon]